MIYNYLKITIRNLLRQKGYSLINILGLSVGLTVSLLILLWVQDELQMDQFHSKSNRIYRVLCNLPNGEAGLMTRSSSPFPLVKYLSENYAEVEDIAAYDPTNKKTFKYNGKEYLEDGIFATSGFFEVLSFPFINGGSQELFKEPNSVAISESLANKLFGIHWKENAMGQTIHLNDQSDFKVAGIFADPPTHSSLLFDFVLSLEQQHADDPNTLPWENFDSRVILKTTEGISVDHFGNKIKDIVSNHSDHAEDTKLILQPFKRMYLHDQFENGKEAGGRIEYVRLFGMAVIFLLLIACINFMNLATAQASKRAKEIGIRKTVGAKRGSLVFQFMTEAVVITFTAVFVAIVLGNLLMPYFQVLSNKELIYDFSSQSFWLLIVGVGLITALIAGSYPALYLSSFRINQVLKGQLSNNFSAGNIRRSLVVFQFVLSALLIVGAFVVRNQVNYIKNKHLGLDKENVLYFRTPPGAKGNLETFKSELLRIPGINNLTFTNSNPLAVGAQTGDPIWEGMLPNENILFNLLLSDENLLTTLNIPLSQGRNFSPLISSDTTSFILNETAAKNMNLQDPIGRKIEFRGTTGMIIGIVQDFHITSLHETIGPLIIANMPNRTGLTLVRIDPNRTEDVIAASQNIFNKFSEGFPFRYDFLDERYLQMYRSEQRIGKLSGWFAIVALIISCLGLLGLSAFVVEQKSKEIGIRKVLGASVLSIVSILSKGFLKLVAIALLIGLPIAWILMTKWLETFAYKVNMPWWIFALTGGVAIVVAFATVSFLCTKAAFTNPVQSLKNE